MLHGRWRSGHTHLVSCVLASVRNKSFIWECEDPAGLLAEAGRTLAELQFPPSAVKTDNPSREEVEGCVEQGSVRMIQPWAPKDHIALPPSQGWGADLEPCALLGKHCTRELYLPAQLLYVLVLK